MIANYDPEGDGWEEEIKGLEDELWKTDPDDNDDCNYKSYNDSDD